MQKPPTDPIISELRAVRDAHAARFDYDVAAIFTDIRARQEASKREYVRFPARAIAATDVDHAPNGDDVEPCATNSS